MKDSTNAIELTAELPGIQASDVRVEIRKNILWLTVVKTEEGSDKYDCVFSITKKLTFLPPPLAHRALGTYSEAFRLPQNIDLHSMKTIGADGKFVISICKTPETETQMEM